MSNPLTPLETYLFDLRGYLVLKNALSPDEVRALNAELDDIKVNQPGQWHGWVHAHSYGGKDGTNFQQIYEAGPAFESLIDHPSWIEKVKTFVGGEGTFDYQHKEMIYTIKKQITYQGNGQMVDIIYKRGTPFKKGKHLIELYSEGFKIGEGTFEVRGGLF